MKKRYVIILIIIFLAIIILAIVNYLQKQNKTADQQTNKTDETQTDINLPVLSGINKAEFSANSQGDLSKQIKSYIDSQISGAPSSGEESGPRDIRFKDSNGNAVTLKNFQQAVGIKVDGQLEKFLKEDDYNFLVCSSKGEEKSYGLLLNIRLLTKEEEHPDVKKILANWEPSMLQNLSKILFRDASFSESDLSKKMDFKSGKYRYAELTLESGEKINLNYVWVDDYVIFATSLECTDEIYNYVYGSD
jgi:hypothetical protein